MKKVAIVTGASRGIGAETAKLLAKNNYAVCVNYHQSQQAAEEIVAEIQAHQGTAIAVHANIALEQDILHLFNTVDEKLGTISALVNNAGINGGIMKVADITATSLNDVFATNVFGTFFCAREALKRMQKNGGGSIVNITSEAAKFGGTHLTHYAASKAAINTFTVGFAREAAPFQVRVNAVSPGVIDTHMHADSPPERLKNLLNSLPMQRMGRTQEVAALIHWLLTDAASYVSGAIIPVTGSR